MRIRTPVAFLVCVLGYSATMGCDCEGGGGLTQGAPVIDRFYIGGSDQAPDLDAFGQTPDSGQLAIDFGLTDVDTINRQYLFLRNRGKSDLVLSELRFEDGSSTDFFAECSNGGPFVDCPVAGQASLAVSSGRDLIVLAAYAPRDLGTDSGSFVLALNAADHKSLTVTLTGEGVTPEIQVCISDCIGDQAGPGCAGAATLCNDDVAPQSLNVAFGDVDMDTRVRRTVTVRNLGDRPLSISSLGFSSGDYNQFGFDTGQASIPGVLPVGQAAVIEVYYDPGTGGTHTAFFQFVSNDVNEREIKLVLSGRGMAPRVCPDPLVLDFGNVSTGLSADRSFGVTNCGLLELSLTRLGLAANTSADFALTGNPAPTTIAPGDTVQVDVRYSPQAAGSDSGGVEIYSNDPASDPVSGLTGTVSLLGTSIPRACDIQATPFAVTFGGVVQGQSGTVNLMVTNQGTDTCILNSAEITTNTPDAEFELLQVPSPNSSFEPGDSLLIVVEYAPVNLGHDSGVLSLFGNDKDGNEVRVDLNGDGVDTAACDLSLSPTALQFGTTKLNQTRSLVLTAVNNGLAPCTVNQVAVYHNFMPGIIVGSEFALTAGAPGGSFTLSARGQPNSRHEIEITFSPTLAGQQLGQLWLHTNDDPDFTLAGPLCVGPGWRQPGLGDACVNLTGLAAKSDIEVVPSELDFGVVTVGCNSPELQVTVYNLGGIALNVADIYLEDPNDRNFVIRSAPQTPFSLAGGASFQIRLRYQPQDTNVHRGALYIVSDASNDDMLIVPLFGRGTNISDQTDVFRQPTEVKSDVLFVVDNSGSMGEEQSALASNFGSFIQHAISLQVDYHIGVVTTEVNSPSQGGSPSRDIIPGVLIQAPNRPKIITNSTPNVTDAFRDNVNVGTCCSDEQEAGLEAAWMTLSEPNITDPGMNAGFLREDAKLYIICVSDEQDQSRGSPDFYVDFFSSIKGYRNTEMMKVSAIVGDASSGCTGTGGTADSGSRYIEVANRTGGIFQSICTGNWAQALQNLGIDAFAAIREFPLSRPADSTTISVTVDGVTIPRASCAGCPDGWTYYADTNSIFFGDNVVPDRGDVIEVRYTAACFP